MLSNPMKLTLKQNKKRKRTEEDGNSIYLHTERNGRRNFLSRQKEETE